MFNLFKIISRIFSINKRYLIVRGTPTKCVSYSTKKIINKSYFK